MRSSLPVSALTLLGVMISVLGLFAAGDIRVTTIGLIALAVAAVLDIWERRSNQLAGRE